MKRNDHAHSNLNISIDDRHFINPGRTKGLEEYMRTLVDDSALISVDFICGVKTDGAARSIVVLVDHTDCIGY